MRFGVSIPLSADGSEPAAHAARAEETGFDFVSVWDHLPGEHPSYETWTALTWVGAKTERIGLLTNVLGLPYRSPAVLAKMAESLQRLSGGRLVLGLGAGGSNEEFASFGLATRSPKEKIDALEEALTVIRGLWTSDEPFTFQGRHYQVKDALISPKPEEPIPIWLGVYGPRALGVLGRLADGWIPSLVYARPEAVADKMEVLRRAAKDAERDPAEIEYAYNVGVKIGEGATSSRGVAGSPAEVAKRLVDIIGMGLTALNFFVGGDQARQWELLAEEVLPRVREGLSR